MGGSRFEGICGRKPPLILERIGELATRSVCEDFFIDLARRYRLYADGPVLNFLHTKLKRESYDIPRK